MYPPVFALLSADSAVAAYVGTRIYPHGRAPERVTASYITWDVGGGSPENTLAELPFVDSYSVRVRVWADRPDGAADIFSIGEAVRDCLEPEAYMESVPITGRDEETLRHYVLMQFRFWVDRFTVSSSGP